MYQFTYNIVLAASEYRAWILYYSLPVLKGYLPPVYHTHLALLVCSMHILLGECITTEAISIAEKMLDDFSSQYENLYGKLQYLS